MNTFLPPHPSLPPSHPSIFVWLSDYLNFVSTQDYRSRGRGVKLFSRQLVIKADFGAFWPLPSLSFFEDEKEGYVENGEEKEG